MIDKKKVANVSLANNVDGFLYPKINNCNFNSSNFIHRLSYFLENKHKKTLKHLQIQNQKNLIIAFTHIDEWGESKMTPQVENLIKMIKLKNPRREETLQNKWNCKEK